MRTISAVALVTTILAGCSGQESETATEPTGDASATAAQADEDTETAAQSPKPQERALASAEMLTLAQEKLAGVEEWQPEAPLVITGPMAEVILDAAPETYISIGANPVDVDMFATMQQPFASDMHYNRNDLTNAEGEVTVRCAGPVTQMEAGGPAIVNACDVIFVQ